MSWSIYASGKPKAVLAKLVSEHEASHKMAEPEQTIKDQVVEVIKTLVGSLPEHIPVKIEASGSQSGHYNSATGGHDKDVTNQVKLEIVPLYNFVE